MIISLRARRASRIMDEEEGLPMEQNNGGGIGCLIAIVAALVLLIGIGWISYVHEEEALRRQTYQEFPNNTPRPPGAPRVTPTPTPTPRTTPTPYTRPRSTPRGGDDDPYDVNDYSSEEDFYDDHYDDFFDYYDAEDYYNEHHD